LVQTVCLVDLRPSGFWYRLFLWWILGLVVFGTDCLSDWVLDLVVFGTDCLSDWILDLVVFGTDCLSGGS
jgi:hypothetical protein